MTQDPQRQEWAKRWGQAVAKAMARHAEDNQRELGRYRRVPLKSRGFVLQAFGPDGALLREYVFSYFQVADAAYSTLCASGATHVRYYAWGANSPDRLLKKWGTPLADHYPTPALSVPGE